MARRIIEMSKMDRGWQRGKTKLFLKYGHISTLVKVLDEKKKEAEAVKAKIAEQRRAREIEEKRIEDARAAEIAKIRAAAEAQPSKIENAPSDATLRRLQSTVKKKKKKTVPTPDGAAENLEAPAPKVPPPVAPKKKMSARGKRMTGCKGRKFGVGMLASRFANSNGKMSTRTRRRSSQDIKVDEPPPPEPPREKTPPPPDDRSVNFSKFQAMFGS